MSTLQSTQATTFENNRTDVHEVVSISSEFGQRRKILCYIHFCCPLFIRIVLL